MPGSRVSTATAVELENLMREFPDWKDQFPDIYDEIHPQIYSKANRKKEKLVDSDGPATNRCALSSETDYKATYHKHRVYRPRSTKRPPPTPLDQHPPPMTFDTIQRAEFTQKNPNAKAELIKNAPQYEAPEGRMDGPSNYQRDYQQYNLPIVRQQPIDPYKTSHKISDARFDSTTTAKEHFKPWNSCASKPYGEMPSFTGSLLYPDRGHQLETTSGTTFRGAFGKRSDPFTLQENLTLEGDMDLKTTHNLTFHGYADARPSDRIKKMADSLAMQRSEFSGLSQTKKDYPGFSRGQPRPPKPAEPAPSTIDLKFDNRVELITEQKRQFPGIDTRLHPMTKSCKQEDKQYKAPTVKFETTTNQKLDYQPKHAQLVHQIPVRPSTFHRADKQPKFDDSTAHKDFFKKWHTPTRHRFGDMHEGHKYQPPTDRFDSKTTNQDTFMGKHAAIPKGFQPEDKPVNQGGEQDFNTMYRVTFEKPRTVNRLNRQQAERLLSELRRRKGDLRGHSQPALCIT